MSQNNPSYYYQNSNSNKKISFKIFGLLRVRNESEIILDTLNHMKDFCSGGIFVYDDCSADNTAELCEKHPSVNKVIRGTIWDSDRAKAEYENRAVILNEAKKWATDADWFVYLDADERIEFEWSKLDDVEKDIIGIRMRLFDFYITHEDIKLKYYQRQFIGPEYRDILIAFRNLPTLAYKEPDQREVYLGSEGKTILDGYVKHYGKAISIEEWEKTCDYYSQHFPQYSEKWEKRKGKAVHTKYSDWGNELITWDEKEEKGVDLYQATQNQLREKGDKLKILISNHHLSGFTGSEIFTLTLAKSLKNNGNDVTVYSKYIGEISSDFKKLNIRVVDNLEVIKNDKFDIAHVHHNITLIEIRNTFPDIPIVFLSQGILPFLENPPVFDLGVSKYLAISEEIKENLINNDISEDSIETIGNLVELEKFNSIKEIEVHPKNALVISSRIDEKKEQIIKKACRQLDINVRFVGGRFGEVRQNILSNLINQSDIIFSLGRGAIEGMMAGRCVIIYDYLGGDGIVTVKSFEEIKKNNFSGRRYGLEYNVDDLVNEIKKYDKNEVDQVKEIAVHEFSSSNVVLRIEKIYNEVLKCNPITYPKENLILAEFINKIIQETLVYSFTKGQTHSQVSLFDSTNGVINFAEKLINEEKLEAAEIVLDQFLNYKPNSIEALNDLAVVSIMKNKNEKALNLIDKVLSIEPKNEVAVENLNYLSEKLNKIKVGNMEDSTIDFANKKLAEAENYIENNQLFEATKLLEEILLNDPNNIDALIDLSVVATIKEEYKHASNILMSVLKIDPENEIALENLLFIRDRINGDNKLPDHFESITCPFCNSDQAEKVRNSADIVKCHDCDTVYLRTRYTKERMYELYQSYADGDSHMAIPASEEEIKGSGLRRNYFMDEILQFVEPGGQFLDIGCGWGAFLDNARDNGFSPVGIEMTKRCVDFANNSLNIKVTNEQFEDTPFENNSIKVVSMNHVLEHLPFPKDALNKLFQIIEPNGMFCGIVPNIDSFASKELKENWYWLDPSYHYVHYTPNTLKHHLEKAGFIVERIYTNTGDYGIQNVKKVLKNIADLDDDELTNMIKRIEKNGEGEEIRFFARKPK